MPGPREQVEIDYQMLQEREENRIRNLQNQQEKAPENVENNETAKGSGMKNSAAAEKRITFDLRQLKVLEGYFQQGMTHPTADSKQILADELGMSSLGQAVEVEAQSIQNWFQNRRQKVKNPEKDKKAKAVLKEVDRSSEASSPEVIYVSNPDLNNSIRYQEQLRSQGNHNPYPQPVHPQVPQVQPAVMGFNPGLAAAINNFGLNILQKPNPFELPGPQGNPNPLMQQIHGPDMGQRPDIGQRPDMVQPAIRGIPGNLIPGGCYCTPCYPSSKHPKGLHSRNCEAQKQGLPIEVPNVPNVQNVQTPDGRNAENPPNQGKPKRIRIAFSKRQVEILDNVYKDNKYPGNIGIQQLALQLNLTFNNVQFWFKNRRRLDRVKEINNK